MKLKILVDDFFDESKGGWERFRPAIIENSPKFHWDNQVKNVLAMYETIKVEPLKSRQKDNEFTAEAFRPQTHDTDAT